MSPFSKLNPLFMVRRRSLSSEHAEQVWSPTTMSQRDEPARTDEWSYTISHAQEQHPAKRIARSCFSRFSLSRCPAETLKKKNMPSFLLYYSSFAFNSDHLFSLRLWRELTHEHTNPSSE